MVTFDVLSSTEIDATGCASGDAGVTAFGSLPAGTSSVTTGDCDVAFGSTNDTAYLRLGQTDGRDRGMWAPTRGALDDSLDGPGVPGNGSFRTGIGSGNDLGIDIAVQPDGKTVVAGICDGSSLDICIARYNEDGSWDTSFDGPTGTGNGRFLLTIGTADDEAFNMLVQPDGRILLSGECDVGATSGAWCLARLMPNGSWDTSFDGPSGSGNGRFIHSLTNDHDHVFAMALQPDGRILVAGDCHTGGGFDTCYGRFDPDGSWDTTFDGPAGTGNGRFLQPIGPGDSSISHLSVMPDGRILSAGECDHQPCFARMTTTGAWDSTFDGPGAPGNGRFLIPGTTPDESSWFIETLDDGRMLVAGTCVGATDDFCLGRFSSTGAWDTSFDGPTGTGNGTFSLAIGSGDDTARSMLVQPDGGLLVGGYCESGPLLDACFARVDESGAWDTTFDGPSGTGNGRFLYSMHANEDGVFSLAATSDGRFMGSGSCYAANDDFCVIRFDNAGELDDYVTGGGSDRDWSSGSSTSTFGVCLRAVSGGANADWTANPTCPATDGAHWQAIPAAGDKVAHTTAPEPEPADATVHLRFGVRPASNQPLGSYVAPITFDVIAPDA